MTGFGVPFNIDDPEGRFIEVHLYVSSDRGKTWQFHDRKNPDATEFPFYSKGDGEYWFALKTLDRDRKFHPDGDAQPELRVVVDTRKPVLEFAAKTDAAGRVVCKWRAQDLEINPASLRISYQAADAPNSEWKSIEYRPVQNQTDAMVVADQLAWWPASASRELIVRIQVADQAGNESSDQRRVIVPRIARNTSDSSTAFRTPAAPCPGGVCKTPSPDVLPGPQFRFAQGPNSPKRQMTQVGSLPEFADPPTPSPSVDLVTSSSPPVSLEPNRNSDRSTSELANRGGPDSIEWGSQSVPTRGLQRQTVASTQSNSTQDRPQASPGVPVGPNQIVGSGAARSGYLQNDFAEPASVNRQTSGAELASVRPKQDVNSRPGFQNSSSSLNNSQLVSGNNHLPSARPVIPNLSEKLAHVDVKAINTRKFLLNYNVDSVDPSGVGKVVLWITRDGGETWKSWANDNDTSSPFPVEMDENGTYGFRVVIHSNDGLSGKPPLRGDDADMWIRIDSDAPEAEILSVPYGTGNEAGRLIINWSASDEKLRTKPIKLSYSTVAQGPWTTIENGLRNTGRYAWKIGRDLPDKIYLRMEVADEAGNVAVQQLTRPIDISGLVPRGRINGVQPIVTQ